MSSETPVNTPSGLMCDLTLTDTPKPQASSTVDRRAPDLISVSVTIPKLPDEGGQSPAYLVSAINGVRELADQLDIIPGDHQSRFKKPIQSSYPPRRSVNVADFPERRESIATQSDADSSLGIIRVDNEPGYSETEDMGKPSEVFANLRRDCNRSLSHSSHKFVLNSENSFRLPQLGSNIDRNQTARVASSNKASDDNKMSFSSLSVSNSYSDIEADLRLRLQKALAQRTLDRTVDSTIRMSQMSDLINDSLSSTCSNMEAGISRPTEDGKTDSTHPSNLTVSLDSAGSFGADNFMSSLNLSQIPQDSLSSETFQPAEAAMARLEEDENSWRQQFADLPTSLQPEKLKQSALTNNIEPNSLLTQNLELSAFSGYINGDITVNSSLTEDAEKRRISMGEYFRLRTEKLGDVVEVREDNAQRPSFGKVIVSPTRSGPHPPLVNISTSQVSSSSLDEVPTRDAGLNATIRSSLADTFDLSSCVDMDASTSKDLPHTSRDLMPPPSAPIRHRHPSGSARETISSRLSTSLPVYKNAKDCLNNDADISSFSMDTERRGSDIASISHIARYIYEVPGSISTRSLVDNLMKEFTSDLRKPSGKPQIAASHSEPDNSDEKESVDSLKHLLSHDNLGEQRVNDWMSSLRNDSLDHNSSVSQDEHLHFQPVERIFKGDVLLKSSTIPGDAHNGGAVALPSKQAVTSSKEVSDLPLSSSDHSETQIVKRSHSTPKLHSRIFRNCAAQCGTNCKSEVENPSWEGNDTLSHGSNDSFNNKKKRQQRSRSVNTQFSEENLSSSGLNKKSFRRFSSSSQNSSSPLKPIESFQQHKSDGRINLSKQLKSGPKTSPSGSEVDRSSLAGSVSSGTKNSSRRTDSTSSGAASLQFDSTHTKLSWASVPVGSSVTQTFALRNRAPVRTRVLVSSTHSAYKLMGERGESLTDLSMTLHPEETRRIHVIFTPSHSGPVVGKLIIRRISTSESSSASADRRLIPLFAYGGVAELSIDGASKDRWSQFFLNMSVADDGQTDVSDVDSTSDIQQMVAFFNVRNTGSVPAFVVLQVATELPFNDSGVYVSPTSVTLSPGQCERVCVRFEPNHDVLLWLNGKASDMQLLANLWLSWSELATWQRIRRVFLKNYGKKEAAGPLSTWGCLYTGDLGVANELRDKQSAETVLAQSVHRIKVTVLVEREKLNTFDMDTTLVFQQLIANESSMLLTPPETAGGAVCGRDSPLLSGNSDGLMKKSSSNHSPPVAFHSPPEGACFSSDLVIYTNVIPQAQQLCQVQFPKTLCDHKSSVKVRFLNPSNESCQVSAQGAASPFTVSTADFVIQSCSYFVMRILYRPQRVGLSLSKLDILVNGKKVRCYELHGECIGE